MADPKVVSEWFTKADEDFDQKIKKIEDVHKIMSVPISLV